MDKCLVLFVEGETEEEFYKAVIQDAKQRIPGHRFSIKIETKNIKGVGGFKNDALRKFIKKIKPKYNAKTKFFVALCRDTDVFEFSAKPPVKWDEIEREFKKLGVEVIHVQAKRSIEDWFLLDEEGIIEFLRLPKKTKINGSSGFDKLQKLYKKANKIYYKGMKSNKMIERLDIPKIVNLIKDQLEPIYVVLGVDLQKKN